MRLKTLLAAVAIGASVAGAAWSWGATGHRLIGEEGMRALPAYMPAFLRTPQAIADVGEYAREPDRWRGSGKVHDRERDMAHFIDLDDDGNTLAGVSLDNLPATRADYEAALRVRGVEPYKAGLMPYATADAWQQVVKDMAFWRILTYLEPRETDKTKKAWYRADRIRREHLMLRDIGVLAHYVGDATQPMHLSIHYNGWGDFPNPEGFTGGRIHSPLEGVYVRDSVTAAEVRAGMTPYTPCTDPIMTCVAARLKPGFAQLVPMYRLEKAGGFQPEDARGKAFMTAQLSLGAGNLQAYLLDAWRESKTMPVGYRTGAYDDFVAGRISDPYSVLYGDD